MQLTGFSQHEMLLAIFIGTLAGLGVGFALGFTLGLKYRKQRSK